MNNGLIFLPVLLQVLLTIALYFALATAKKKAVAANEVNLERRGLYDDAWPVSVVKINNCIRNQFEVPVLFYILSGVLWALDATSWFVVAVSWVFVLSRYAHAYVQTGSNQVPQRLRFFKIGVFAVIALLGTAVYSAFS